MKNTSITIAAVIFYAIGASEILGGAILLIAMSEIYRGFGVLTLLFSSVDLAGGFGLWRGEIFLGLVLCLVGIFSAGADMLFIPLLIGASSFAFIYAFSIIIGYIVILIIISYNWRSLLENI